MQTKLKVTVAYLDGRPDTVDEMPADIPAGAEQNACLQLLGAINATGGLMQYIENGISIVPLHTIKKLTITSSSIAGANLSDLANLKMPTRKQ
jgi:butyrate kinase